GEFSPGNGHTNPPDIQRRALPPTALLTSLCTGCAQPWITQGCFAGVVDGMWRGKDPVAAERGASLATSGRSYNAQFGTSSVQRSCHLRRVAVYSLSPPPAAAAVVGCP